MKVDFYHLTLHPIERVLPRLAERVLADGGRLLIVSGEEVQRNALDKLLWSYSPDSFLPHAQVGSERDADQPLLIGSDPQAANAARNILIADGVWRNEALAFDRAFHLFDEISITAARTAWRGLGDKPDIERRYWKQDEAGRWQQAA